MKRPIAKVGGTKILNIREVLKAAAEKEKQK